MKSQLSARSILRWAGSKRQLIPELLKWTPKEFDRYIEPFAGSACLFFHLQPSKAILGDINSELMSTYRQIRRAPTALYDAVSKIKRDPETYYSERAKNPSLLSAFNRAVRFIYLNRNCFNAVYRVNKRGQFNVPWGTRTGELPSHGEFLSCARILKAAKLMTSDFEKVIDNAGSGDFVYVDPPYTKSVAGEPGLFGAGAFGKPDLARLIYSLKMASERGATFLLSFEYDEQLMMDLSTINSRIVVAHRHVARYSGRRGPVRELMFTNAKDLVND